MAPFSRDPADQPEYAFQTSLRPAEIHLLSSSTSLHTTALSPRCLLAAARVVDAPIRLPNHRMKKVRRNKNKRQQMNTLPRLVVLQGVPATVRWMIFGLLGYPFTPFIDADTCLEQLARAACADDDGHVHATEESLETKSLISGDGCEIKGE